MCKRIDQVAWVKLILYRVIQRQLEISPPNSRKKSWCTNAQEFESRGKLFTHNRKEGSACLLSVSWDVGFLWFIFSHWNIQQCHSEWDSRRWLRERGNVNQLPWRTRRQTGGKCGASLGSVDWFDVSSHSFKVSLINIPCCCSFLLFS